jgi:lipoprotein-anchoring transpeptidase ErfK/SrfK
MTKSIGEWENGMVDQSVMATDNPPGRTTKNEGMPARRNKNFVKYWLLAILFLISLPVIAGQITPARGANDPLHGYLQEVSNLTPTVALTAKTTSTPTPTRATETPSISGATVRVFNDISNLRAGPGTNYAISQKVTYGEQLVVIGRLADNSWLYVKTSDGQVGWIKTTLVELVGVNGGVTEFPVQTPPPSPDTVIKVSSDLVNLRSGPGTYYIVVRKVIFSEQLVLLGRLADKTWLYVKTSDGQQGWVKASYVDLTGINLDSEYRPVLTPPPTETATPVVLSGIEGHWIDIDLSEQMLYAYNGTERVASFKVSTGIERYPTVAGQYHIYVKYRYSDMHGNDYFLPNVPWTMYYNGDFSIHGTYWHHSFGIPMSRGCVNMDISDAEWLYAWSPVGTLVNIHR